MSRVKVFFACCTIVCGCGGGEAQRSKPKTGPSGFQVSKEDRSRCDRKNKKVVPLDLNQDQEPDVWKIYMAKTENGAKVDVLSCKEQDLNFDGRRDIWIYYDDVGNRQMEEMDLDFDGKVDLVTIRRGGKVIRKELDTNYDGRPDILQHFEEEVLVRVERDSNTNGKIDYWEYYEGGDLDRVGYDKDGDGRPDEFDRAPPKAQPAPAAPAPEAPPAEEKS